RALRDHPSNRARPSQSRALTEPSAACPRPAFRFGAHRSSRKCEVGSRSRRGRRGGIDRIGGMKGSSRGCSDATFSDLLPVSPLGFPPNCSRQVAPPTGTGYPALTVPQAKSSCWQFLRQTIARGVIRRFGSERAGRAGLIVPNHSRVPPSFIPHSY